MSLLTDEEINKLCPEQWADWPTSARAIEAAVIQKLIGVDVDPVAYRIPEPDLGKIHHYFDVVEIKSHHEKLEALHTTEQLAAAVAQTVANERERCAIQCDKQHDRARTSTGAARAYACADTIRSQEKTPNEFSNTNKF